MHGAVLQPGDEGYDEARTVWNAMVDKKPAVIARCTGTADVIAAVNFARDLDLLVSVKGGGHNVAGTAVCDDSLMIDLSLMNSVRIDPTTQTARVQGGATWGDFDHEAQHQHENTLPRDWRKNRTISFRGIGEHVRGRERMLMHVHDAIC